MKKWFAVLAACTMIFALAACGGGAAAREDPAALSQPQAEAPAAPSEPSGPESVAAESGAPGTAEDPQGGEETSESTAAAEENKEDERMKSLVVYFSWSGNTESVANEIQSQTGADLFELVPLTPYTDDYNALLDVAQEEQRAGARPAISGSVDLSGYDVIYLGCPNWWGDMPMILYTFLDGYDLSGKTVAPFVTSGGSGFSGTIGAIQSMEPDASVAEGLSLGSSAAADPGAAVAEWLDGLGLA